MNLNRAIIPIQELNCQNCANELVNILSQIEFVSQLGVDYKSSQVYFNFQNIRGVSEVENVLAELGFNPVGEEIQQEKDNGFFCKDASKKLCINGNYTK